ncbi:TPA: hypothetical protein ACNMRT_004869 [Klebsiella pneumoniae]|uniref:hypothetical protein n=1 Tax=Klebsiella pneumoniae TaxID=573 RepID=UPI00192AA70F|nr:hypothetical protein [Klebsiella pneumoniae]EJZ8831265.1 hypothetical protein [Klebsiella pneumoniae]EKL8589807.1 hypothetical protein [Klebsiella pneumoniae]EKV6039883.1 hypothetical protein [Klebsiella pneumoniae]EKW0931367.1 hypothetical protein [Klebsiella pneumoniae]EKW4087364.1 hypothetical protein [Klebsiella pneumoniae]
MKAGVCLFLESFSLDRGEKIILEQLSHLRSLMARMNSEFIKFYKSNEYDCKLATMFYSTSPDMAWMMGQFYDMGKIDTLPMDCDNLLKIINSVPPVYNSRMLYMYNSIDNTIVTENRQSTVLNEKELVIICRNILDSFPTEYIEYGNSVKDIFKNLIFLENQEHPTFKTFNSMNKIKGGFENFIRGITEFLFVVNNYEVIPQDTFKNIKQMSALLRYELCEEGGKKSERKQGELNRDFKIGNIVYKDINCEFHYKLSYKDGQFNKGTYYNDNRIYFGFFNRIDPSKPMIAVAHIGEHL